MLRNGAGWAALFPCADVARLRCRVLIHDDQPGPDEQHMRLTNRAQHLERQLCPATLLVIGGVTGRASKEAQAVMRLDAHAFAGGPDVEVAEHHCFGVAVADAGQAQSTVLSFSVTEDFARADHGAISTTLTPARRALRTMSAVPRPPGKAMTQSG